jgi:hypothetical protein
LFSGAIAGTIIWISYPSYVEKSYFSGSWHYFKGDRNALIDELKSLRSTSPRTSILEATTELMSQNPLKRCSARPFVFPAFSERPWVGVLHSPGIDCKYEFYGYEYYGVSSSGDRVSIPPVIPDGLAIQPVVP